MGLGLPTNFCSTFHGFMDTEEVVKMCYYCIDISMCYVICVMLYVLYQIHFFTYLLFCGILCYVMLCYIMNQICYYVIYYCILFITVYHYLLSMYLSFVGHCHIYHIYVF